MSEIVALVYTDVVDSTLLNARWGDEVMNRAWIGHDSAARQLMRTWGGREVGRGDGFLVTFSSVENAVRFALAYHRSLAMLEPPLEARVGVHVGPILLRENSSADTEGGATHFDMHGLAVPVVTRVMSVAAGRQTLLSDAAVRALGPTELRVHSHGFWRLKGLPEPIEISEVGESFARFVPPPDSTKAYRIVRADDGWDTLGDIPRNLPAERDGFIGRNEALRAVAELFDSDARLVTLLGIGGIGKTRLALRYARSWLGDYSGGAWFCDLSTARSSAGIVQAVAQGLNLSLGKGDPIQQVGNAIAARKQCVIILDNFEQVARHAEATLGSWLERAPDARFIATSREVLGIVGEQTLALAPLDSDDATRMFVQRVRALGVRGEYGPDDLAAIGPLVNLLDRLPLAIELAAARARIMPPRVLLQRMSARFKVLVTTGKRRDRQATLKATLDWSWDLLSPAEQSALAQVSVFEGGFTLLAAEAVIDMSCFEAAPDPASLVQILLEKSLVFQRSDDRFDLLGAVQEYAAERLTAGESCSTTEQAHAHYFNELLHQLRRAVEIGDRDALAQVDADFENCRRAWAWSIEHGQTEALTNTALTLRSYCDHRGRFEDGLALFRLAFESPSVQQDPRAAPLMLSIASFFEYRLDQYVAAESDAARALAATRRDSDRGTRMQALNVLATCALRLGRLEVARHFFKQLLDEASPEDAAQSMAMTLDHLALIEKSMGQYDEALRLSLRALEQYRRLGDLADVALCLNNLGSLHLVRNDYEAAGVYLREGLEICERAGIVNTRGIILANLCEVERNKGDIAAAEGYASRAREVATSTGNRAVEASAMLQTAQLAVRRGELDAARSALAGGLGIATTLGMPSLKFDALVCFAEILEAQGETTCARRVEAFGAGHPSASAPHRDEFRRMLAQRHGADNDTSTWPGIEIDELVHRIVAETDIKYAPLIAILCGAH